MRIVEAFAALDAMSAQMVRTGAPSDALVLVVVDEFGDVWCHGLRRLRGSSARYRLEAPALCLGSCGVDRFAS